MVDFMFGQHFFLLMIFLLFICPIQVFVTSPNIYMLNDFLYGLGFYICSTTFYMLNDFLYAQRLLFMCSTTFYMLNDYFLCAQPS